MVSFLSNQQNTAVHDHDDAVGQAGYKEKHQQDGRPLKWFFWYGISSWYWGYHPVAGLTISAPPSRKVQPMQWQMATACSICAINSSEFWGIEVHYQGRLK